jgi:transmembrane protein EpsG
MLIWITNILLLFFYAFVFYALRIDPKKQKALLLWIMFFQLLFLYTFKDNSIFNDIWAYLYAFDISKSISWADMLRGEYSTQSLNFQAAWWYYSKFLSSIYANNILIILVTGFVIIMSYLAHINRYSRLPWLSLFLFIMITFYGSLFLMRQTMAAAICLYSIPYIVERKIIKSFLIIALAYSIHNTAAIFILLYFINPKKISINIIVKYMFIGLIVYNVFSIMIQFAVEYYTGYRVYLNYETGSNITPMLISLTILLFIAYAYYPYKRMANEDRLFFLMVIITAILDVSRIGFSGTIGRLSIYLAPATIIILPNAINQLRNPYIKICSIAVITVLYMLMMNNQFNYGYELKF